MASIRGGANGVLYAMVPMFLVHLSLFVSADVDIIFYDSSSADCSGTGVACAGIYSDTCCDAGYDAGAVLSYTDSGAGCLGTQYYSGGSCGTLEYTSNGNTCLQGDVGYTGAYWFNSCRRRSLLEVVKSTKPVACSKYVKPFGVVFSEDGTKGHWIASTSDATELYWQLKNVHDSEKVDWLKSKGATYKALESDLKVASKLPGN